MWVPAPSHSPLQRRSKIALYLGQTGMFVFESVSKSFTNLRLSWLFPCIVQKKDGRLRMHCLAFAGSGSAT